VALHVDILKVDPLAGGERVLARVALDDTGQIVIDAPDKQYWRDALARATHIDPDEAPKQFLFALSERLDGTYVVATEPHDEGDCEHAAEPALESTTA
jgi:hypothetical protein